MEPIYFPKPLWAGWAEPLRKAIDKIEDAAKADTSTQQKPAKKALILNTALANLLPQPFTTETKVWPLPHPQNYRFDTSTKPPHYFSTPFKNNTVDVSAGPHTPYDYSKYGDEVWVDFANSKLGGGVFGDGMLQEETMALSMPELADAAAIGYYTRTDFKKEGPLGSNPTPLVLTKVHRTIELDQKLYRNGWETISVDEVKNKITPQKPNQDPNILAVAVPKLQYFKDKVQMWQEQTDPATLGDLFNTFDAAYEVAKEAKPHTTINTGPIGTGDFNHHPEVIYVLQHLAAQQVGVNLRYWYESKQSDFDKVVIEIIKEWNGGTDKSINSLLVHAQNYFKSHPQTA